MILSYFVVEGVGCRVNRMRVQVLGQGSRLVFSALLLTIHGCVTMAKVISISVPEKNELNNSF